jgi:hypothetical protein
MRFNVKTALVALNFSPRLKIQAFRFVEHALMFLELQVQACGSMVTEEQPHAMLIPMEFFFMGFGLYRPGRVSDSPRSPLSPSCISPELLSPESLGLKLKPIKTRVPTKC